MSEKKLGVGFDARAHNATTVRYRVGGGAYQEGPFNAAAQAFLSHGGGEYIQGAGPIDPAGYKLRYGGAVPGVQWQGASAEKLMDVGKALGKAFAAGRLGAASEWSGNATWQECIDYAACWQTGRGPFAEFEFHATGPKGSSASDPIPVDDESRPYGAVWQLPPPDSRWAINVHGSGEKPVLVIKPGDHPPEPDPLKVPKDLIAHLREMEGLTGTVTMGPGRKAAIHQARLLIESVAKLHGEEK